MFHKQVDKKRSTNVIYRNADSLRNTSTKHNKYAVNYKLEHFNDVNVREPFVQWLKDLSPHEKNTQVDHICK